ncbi:MAG: D-alanyl-D-alanine carboxypeptidase, partial [Rhodospirillaceae bacterium]|nr:D-alanyl-D-alanine carboxypeptidase [Rhodospirillaceae bacterium]
KAMTAKAETLGLAGSRFANATGFSAKNHRMTAADVAKLAGLVLDRYPLDYGIFGERSFSFRGKSYANRNPLLGSFAGADGLKTGQTAAGGYGLVASAVRGGKRLIVVINGLPSEEARAAEAKRLLDWGFSRVAR